MWSELEQKGEGIICSYFCLNECVCFAWFCQYFEVGKWTRNFNIVDKFLDFKFQLNDDNEMCLEVEACPNEAAELETEAGELEKEAEIEKVKKNLHFDDNDDEDAKDKNIDPKSKPELESRQTEEVFDHEELELEDVHQAQDNENREIATEIDEQNHFDEGKQADHITHLSIANMIYSRDLFYIL